MVDAFWKRPLRSSLLPLLKIAWNSMSAIDFSWYQISTAGSDAMSIICFWGWPREFRPPKIRGRSPNLRRGKATARLDTWINVDPWIISLIRCYSLLNLSKSDVRWDDNMHSGHNLPQFLSSSLCLMSRNLRSVTSMPLAFQCLGIWPSMMNPDFRLLSHEVSPILIVTAIFVDPDWTLVIGLNYH